MGAALILCNDVMIGGASQLGCVLAPYFVNQVDDDIVLLDAQAIEVFPHSHGELLSVLSYFFPPCHGRGVYADAAWSHEYRLVEGAGEGAGRVELVFAAVCVESVSVESRPLKLSEPVSDEGKSRYCMRA